MIAMKRMIKTEWYNEYNEIRSGETLVEFIRYAEDGQIINEITQVFLPEYAPFNTSLQNAIRQRVIEAFHRGEGYTLY